MLGTRRIRLLICLWLTLSGQGSAGSPPQSSDWPSWRGPEQNGISRETGLVDRFNPRGGEGSNLLWKNGEAAGISTPIVLKEKLYTVVRDAPNTPRDAEKIICLDAKTGSKLWEYRFNVFLSDVPGERVGWANCAGDPQTARVYVLGSCCLLQCFEGETGKLVWSRSLSEEFGMLSTYGGRTNTPVIFEDLVIVSGVTTGWNEQARPAHRFLAFDKQDGRLVWINGTRPLPDDTTYSTPFTTVIDGKSVCFAGSGDGGVHAFQPRTGKLMGSYQLSRRGVNVSPIVAGNRVYIGHAEENPTGTAMGAVAAVDAAALSKPMTPVEIWKTESVPNGRSSPLLVEGRLYVIDDSAGFRVFNVDTGMQIGRTFKLGTSMRGSPLWADGKIYCCTSAGVFHVIQPDPQGAKSVFKVRLPTGEECGGSPIVANGRIYLPTTGGLYCLGQADHPTSASARPEAPKETPPAADVKPRQIQLVPAEVLVRPGESIRFEVRMFDEAGRKLESKSAVRFMVSEGGEIDSDGILSVSPTAAHGYATVTAEVDGVQASALVRMVPPLPWRFDFSNGEVPITWIAARYRHEPRTVDGEPIIVKISTIPKGTRSQSWMGPTDLHDYTVQADLKAGVGTVLPDMGIIGQRYTLDLMGEAQQLQIRTWTAQLRMAKSASFAWEKDVWYTLKLQASNQNGVAVLRGKAWKRGESEPTDWVVTATDESPNRNGSPGLFGNATNAEIFIDNVTVTPN